MQYLGLFFFTFTFPGILIGILLENFLKTMKKTERRRS